MSRIVHNLQLPLSEELEERLAWMFPGHGGYRILRQSVDARQRHAPRFVYSLELADPGEALEAPSIQLERIDGIGSQPRPVVVGSGPAGLFAALRLVERGVPCLLLERGSETSARLRAITRFWRTGELDPRNNVCYGEGGAGLFSDGKLITRIRSPHIPYVLNRLVRFGAPPEIEWLSNPHVGSDRIRRVIPKLRAFLLENGCEIRFDTRFDSLVTAGGSITGLRTGSGELIPCTELVLATGHSAEDVLRRLQEQGVALEGKSFAMGLRVEHPQQLINQIQYREACGHPKLGAANYRLADHDRATGIGVYSFCMCPGGYVLSSGTEPDGIVCNGMSNYHRNSPFANAALVVSIDFASRFGADLWGGMRLRRELEQRAFAAVRDAGGIRELPAQRLGDFLAGRSSPLPKGSSISGAVPVRLDQLLPGDLRGEIIRALKKFERLMPGFTDENAVFYGVETRTSCPLRIPRDEQSLESCSHPGLYPAGEGAGYAGGITSAACDGVSIGDRIAERLAGRELGLTQRGTKNGGEGVAPPGSTRSPRP